MIDAGYTIQTTPGNAAIAAVAPVAGVTTGNAAVDAAASTTTRGMTSGSHGSSRLRFVGVEDLGAGNKATFWLEMSPSLETGATNATLFNRGAWLGLKGASWGELRLGRQGSNSIGLICAVDGFGCQSGFVGGVLFNGTGPFGSAGNSWISANPTRGRPTGTGAATALASSTGGDSTRYVKAIRYSLPTLANGLDINVTSAYGAANAVDGSNGGNTLGLDALYTAGPLTVGAAYQKAAAEAVANSSSGTLLTIGGTYDLKVVKLGALVQRETATATGATVLGYDSSKAFALTAIVPMGSFTPYAKAGNHSNTLGGASFVNSQVINFGTHYSLSKSTYLYADYARNNASVSNIGPGATANPKVLTTGVQVTF
jgi:predicted porin